MFHGTGNVVITIPKASARPASFDSDISLTHIRMQMNENAIDQSSAAS